MVMSKWMRNAFSLIMSACLAFSMVPATAFAASTGSDSSSNECYGYLYKGDPFPYDGTHYKFALYCVQKDVVEGIDFGSDITAAQQAELNDKAEVVYCMDASKNEPTTAQASLDKNGTWPTYNKLAADTDSLLNGCTSRGKSGYAITVHSDEEIMRGLAWVASNGYPNSTFQGDMSVSDYRAVTQWAVYYWTMGRSGMTSLQTAAQKEAAKSFMTVPDDFDADSVLAGMSVYKPTANLSNPQWLFGFKAVADAPEPPEPPTDLEPRAASSVTFAPCAKKTLEGGTLAKGQFTFDLYENGKVIDTAKNDADGNITFKSITYSGAGTHTYTVKERNDAQDGVTCDTTEKTFTVKVTTHSAQTYDASATYYGRETYDYDEGLQYFIGTSATDLGIQMFCTNADVSGPQDESAASQTYTAVINPTAIVTSKDAAAGSMVNSNRYGSDAELQENLRKLFYYFETDDAKSLPNDIKQRMVWYATGVDKTGDGNTYKVNGVTVKTSKSASIKPMLDAVYQTVNAPAGYNLVFFLPTAQQIANKHPQPLATGYGTVVSYEAGVPTFTNSIDDEPVLVDTAVSKTDLGGKGVVGAKLTITEGDDGQGTEVASWETEADENGDAVEHKVSGLEANKVYMLTETIAPKNYEQAESIVFKVSEDGKVLVRNDEGDFAEVGTELTMVDGYASHEILFSKTDLAGKEIGGAQITVSGTELHGGAIQDISWESVENQSHKISLKPGTYTFHEEAAPAGYKAVTDIVFTVALDGSIEVIGNDGNEVEAKDGVLTVTDQYDDSTVSVGGAKIWDDAHNQDGKRPESIEIALYCNGQATGKTQAVTAADQWQYSFTGLPKYTEGELNTYTVQEDKVPEGYTASVDGYDVTNAHELETVDVEGTKTWVDGDDQSKRPESIEVELYADGVFVKSQTVKADKNGDWKYSFTNLPKYVQKDATQASDPAVEVKYTVAEKTVDGYVTDVDGTNLTNTRSDKTAVHVQKAWSDVNDADGIRPESVTVRLLADGLETGKALTLNAANNWHAHFADLEAFNDEGDKIAYTVSEDAVEGYSSQIVADDKIDEADAQGVSHAYRIVNTHEVERVSVSGTKIWVDGDDANGLRPAFIVVDLYANGEPYASAKVIPNADGEWAYTFDKLIKNHAGQEVVYTVRESAVPDGYVSTVEGSNIVNTHEVTHDIEVSKVDLGGKEIEGAEVSIKNADGSLVKAWRSGKGSTTVSLTKGEYVFHETLAPEGYTVVTDIKFTVDESGKVTVTSTDVSGGSAKGGDNALTVTDDYQARKVSFSKTDLGGDELAGADITVSGTVEGFDAGDVAGKVSESWKSDGTAKVLELKPGTYKMTETAAPDGYEIATEIEFTVNLDGTITVGKTTSKSEAENVVTMVDDYTVHNVAISKTDLGGEEIEGAKITVSDSDRSGKKVEESWTSGEDKDEEGKPAPHALGLKPGTYTFHEEVAPKGYTVVTDIEFEVGLDGKVTVTSTDVSGGSAEGGDKALTVTDGYEDQEVTFSKVDLDGKEIGGAQIVVYDRDGNVVDQWTSEEGKSHTAKLQPGTYVFHEEAAPTGYVAVTDITFTVDKDGVVTVDDAAGNTVEVDSDGKLVVTDQFEKTTRDGGNEGGNDEGGNDGGSGDGAASDEPNDEPSDEPSDESAKDKTAKKASSVKGKTVQHYSAVKTGDTLAPLAVGICCFVLAACGFGVARRRKRQ